MIDYFELEKEVLEWINKARSYPKSIVPHLKEMLPAFNGQYFKHLRTGVNVLTEEGDFAVFEAISYLINRDPVEPLKYSKGLTRAARDLAYDIGPKGLISHQGSDQSTMAQRAERYGKFGSLIAENISFSEITGKDIVLQFLIDDGDRNRSSRNNILSTE